MNLYPTFAEIKKEDLPLFNEAFYTSPPKISEFTFTNLYAWKDVYKLKACLLGGLIILRSESEGSFRFFDPIGKGEKKEAIQKLSNDFKSIFIRLPEATKDLFVPDARFQIEPDRDSFDYLYNTQDLITLKGKKYDGKRNQIKKFKTSYAYEYMTIDDSSCKELRKFQEYWCAIKNCDKVEGLSNERQAIHEMVCNFTAFNIIAGAISLQGDIRAVAFGQRLNPDTLVMHALKADPNISGLYQVILNEFLSKEASQFKYVNLEQDLGQVGLRKSKESYHPIEMVKKYTLKPIGVK